MPITILNTTDPVGEQLHHIGRRLHELDTRQQACGLPRLSQQDIHRGMEIMARASRLPYATSPAEARDLLLSLAAHCVASLLWLDRAEELDPTSGDGEAA